MRLERIRVGHVFMGHDGKQFRWGLNHFLDIAVNNLPDASSIIKERVVIDGEVLERCGFKFYEGEWIRSDDSPFAVRMQRCEAVMPSWWVDCEPYCEIQITFLDELQDILALVLGIEL